MRKIFLAATAVATFAAAPAFAQQMWMGQPAPAPINPYASSWATGYGDAVRHQRRGPYAAVSGPFASVDSTTGTFMAPGFAPNAVFGINGRYIGSDPDPRIRQSLIRDQEILLGRGPAG